MAIFDTKFTNVFGDSEIATTSPDAENDWFYITDYAQDHDYWQAKIADALKALSTSPSTECQIIYGGVVTDGGAGTINISEGVAIGKDTGGFFRIFKIAQVTGLVIPTDVGDNWCNGRQIWVIGKYDFKLSSQQRTHFNGSTYTYTLEDTYLGDTDSENTALATDLLVDANPNATPDTVVCWGSFTMTGTTYAGQSGRTSSYGLNIAGNSTFGGTLAVTGISTLTGLLNANGGIAVNTNAFTVAHTSGNTLIAGTLGVTGALTATGGIIMADGATIGQAAGPLVAFDDSNNYLEITGCNVGIGTTAPGYLLHLVKDLSGAATPLALINNTNNAANQIQMLFANYGDTNGFTVGKIISSNVTYLGMGYVWNGENAGIMFGTNNTEKMRITSSGNVGIGTTAPECTLDSNGVIRVIGTYAPPASGEGLEIGYNTTFAQINSYNRTTPAYTQLRIDGSSLLLNSANGGNVGIAKTNPGYLIDTESSGGGYYDVSDHQWHNGSSFEIYKTNISDLALTSVCNDIKAVKIREYQYKDISIEKDENDEEKEVITEPDENKMYVKGYVYDELPKQLQDNVCGNGGGLTMNGLFVYMTAFAKEIIQRIEALEKI